MGGLAPGFFLLHGNNTKGPFTPVHGSHPDQGSTERMSLLWNLCPYSSFLYHAIVERTEILCIQTCLFISACPHSGTIGLWPVSLYTCFEEGENSASHRLKVTIDKPNFSRKHPLCTIEFYRICFCIYECAVFAAPAAKNRINLHAFQWHWGQWGGVLAGLGARTGLDIPKAAECK